MENDQHLRAYLEASSAVRRRIGWIEFSKWVKNGHVAIGATGLILVLLLRRIEGWDHFEFAWLFGLFALWALVGAVISIRRMPGTHRALVALDRSGGWKDQFASAWAYLNQERRSAGEKLHIERAENCLGDALGSFPEASPIPSLRWCWVLPLMAFGFALTPWFRLAPNPSDSLLSSEMVEAANGKAEAILGESQRLDGLKVLTEEQRKDLDQLQEEIDDLAGQLSDAEGLTAGELLEALEERARAAERLARGVDSGADDWASEAMLAEMARYPDTVDLSVAIREKNAESAADEASSLQGLLDDDALSSSIEERLVLATARIVDAAEEADETKPVGERFGNASRKLEQSQPLQAAREFEELAAHFRILGEQDKARRALEDLAETLRESGSEISGKELEKMEEIARAAGESPSVPEGLKALESDELARELNEMVAPHLEKDSTSGEEPNLAGGAGEAVAPPVPGTSDSQSSGDQSGQQQTLKAPIPGESPQEGEGGSTMAMDSGESSNGQSLQAPIPGMAPAGPGEGAGAGMAGRPGDSSVSGQGGDQAGTGTAELVDTESSIFEARNDSRVTAQINDDGESTFREVEGGVRTETASRSAQEVAADFLAVEEQALDGQSLPLSRREHVIRYFSALRRQFEREDQ